MTLRAVVPGIVACILTIPLQSTDVDQHRQLGPK